MQDNHSSELQLSVLGPFALSAGKGASIEVRGEKVRGLLVYLAVEATVQRRDVLMTMFWPDLRQESAQANLRQTMYRLRKALPSRSLPADGKNGAAVPLIISDRHSVQINRDADFQVDVITFRQLVRETRIHQHQSLRDCEHCMRQLEEAVSLYRGDFLVDLYFTDSNQFEDWAGSVRAELRQDALTVLEELGQAYLDNGNVEKAETWARRQIQLDSLRESAYRQLMQSLAQSGHKAEALAQFDVCRQILQEELGTAPSPETITLYERIQAGDLDSSATPGIRIREYIIMEELNSGAFGSIYRAYQPSVEREVAIKVILPRYANQPEFVQRMESEARFVARLEHPHIVPLYDYWRDSSGAYLVMRWLRSGSLETRLKQGPLEINVVLGLLDQVASALAETHQQGIVHRDLKPGNIVLDEQGNAYLTDFGIAMDLDVDVRITAPGTLMGSPAYMAPELLRNEAVTPQTDIYSLGIILFELLTGKLPYRASGMAALIQQHLNEPLPSVLDERPDLPHDVDWVLGRATAKIADARYADVMILATSMKQALLPYLENSVGSDAAQLPAETRPRPFTEIEPLSQRESKRDFVGRERQLDKLKSFLDETLSGNGRIACVTGGSGRGKTTLINEFARRAMKLNSELLVAVGSCNIFSAAGDPYLPFRNLLSMLTADVEAQVRAGAVSQEHARRLHNALPVTVEAIVDEGAELLDVLVPAKALLERSRVMQGHHGKGGKRLQQLITTSPSSDSQMERKRLFSQFTAVLHAISQIYPIILVLDDLQWIDKTSASLLYHLSRHLGGQRLLVVCAYRQDEVALGRDGERHPMDKVLSEVKGVFGSIWIDLADLQQEEERQFINRLLDQEPNKFTNDFRQSLFEHTTGHALFTVELLRAMQERGDLLHDDSGDWIESRTLDWDTLPPRIEGVIEERIGRLSPELRSLLNIASVEGELFTAEVIANIEGKDVRSVLQLLSRELEGIHHLVKEQEEVRVAQDYLTRYRFGHVLIQQYLYAQLGSGERRLLHAQIAGQLQELVEDQWRSFATELAWHWQKAGRRDEAVEKWLWLGDQARAAYAHAEAENYYTQAVSELRGMGQLDIAARTLMKLGLVHTADFQPIKAQEVYDQAFTLWQPARQIQEIEDDEHSSAVLRLATELPVSFDPGLIDDDVSTFLITQLFEGLVRVGQDQNVLPAIADSWKVLGSGTRYVFHIRENACWNDGTPLTAADFVFSWTRNLDPQTNSPSAHLLYVLKNARDYAEGKIADADAVGVKALDERTLAVHLERPTAYLPYLMAHTVAFPLPHLALKGSGHALADLPHMLSNGPFQVEVFDNNELILTKNPRYIGQFKGNLGAIECLFSDDYDKVLQAYGRNQLDFVNLIHAGPDTIARAGSLFGKELISIPRWSTFYLCFRCDKPPFDDVRVRQALAYALDREALASKGFQGLRQAALGGFVPPGMPGHSPDIALTYNPERGRELLLEAGFGNGEDFPAIEWAASAGGERVISFLQSTWKKNLRLDLTPNVLDLETFMERLNSDPAQLTILAWGADIPDPENMLRSTFHSQDGFNIPHWHNDRFDLLTDKAEQVTDHAQRMSLYEQADQILVAEETAVLPLSYALGRLLVKPWVKLPNMSGISISFRFASVVHPD